MKFDKDAYLAMLAVYREDRQEEVRRGEITQEDADFRCWMFQDELLYMFDDD